MGHCASMLGHGMVVYGGIFGEENRVIDDIALFDMITRQWTRIKISKSSRSIIGPLAYFSMTHVCERKIPISSFESRLMWI